ncbi:MAG: T9SS C-terminal target domain-containing protein, partial [Bacteroidia bacterium]
GAGNYSYRVTARNLKGTGGTAVSNIVFLTPEGVSAISIGDGNILFGMPYDFFWEHSISQTLYFADEIGLPGAVITGLQYQHVFNADALDKDIMIWLGETGQNDLSSGYIDPASLQLAFDGKVDFLADETEVIIVLENPYFYSGGNLVVYSMKADNVWSSGKNFKQTLSDPNVNRSAKSFRDFTPFDPLNPGQPDQLPVSFPNITIYFSDDGFGALQGTVADGVNSLEGVKVEVLETNTATHTDGNGFFQLAALASGSYDMLFTKFGYEDLLLENVIIEEDETTEVSVTITELPTFSVSGTVTGNDGELVEGASVILNGMDEYVTETGADGSFFFAEVFGGTYDLTVVASGYTAYSENNLSVDEDLVLDIELEVLILAPGGLSVDVDNHGAGNALFSWTTGADTEFRYDNGTPLNSLGTFDANLNTVIGAAHRNIAELFEMSWMMPVDGSVVPSDVVKVWVFGLDDAGNPNQNNVLYSQGNVSNVPGEWNTYAFGQPVFAPNGFLIGLSVNGDLVLVTDSGNDPDWPFIPETQFYNFNVTSSPFTPIEQAGFEWNFFIRANGIDLGEINQQQAQDFPRNAIGFNVFLDDAFVSFVEEEEYLFTGLDEGTYIAGVQSLYATGESDIVTIDFEIAFPVSVTLNVTTITGQSPEGALAELTAIDSQDGVTYQGIAGTDGVIFLPEVKKGSYVLEVSLENHNSFINEALVIDQDLELNIELSEATDAPFNLTVVTDGLEAGQALLTWNNPTQGWAETFDSGQLPDGWTQIITNSGTNAGLPTTWHVTGTVPFYSSSIEPRTGDYQVFMMWDFQHQDEWLITPEFTAPAGDLTFWYHGVTGSTFGDNYYVKISTDGGNSWTVLWNASDLPPSQNYYQSPVSIDLTHYAGQDVHIAWHNVDGPSNFGMWYMWAIDDIAVGEMEIDPRDLLVGSGIDGDVLANSQPIAAGSTQQSNAATLAVNGFNIFLNGTLVAEGVPDTQYLFAQLADGEHTAGVQAVYTTGVSEIVEKDFIIHENNLLALVAQPAGSGMLGGSAWYPAGEEVVVFATPNDGFVFLNWSDTQGNIVSEEPAFLFTMPDNDVILIANFEDFETFNLTFYLDMSNLDWLNFDQDMVNVTGSMHGWAVLGENARDQSMMQIDNSHTFKISFNLPSGEYSYAYFLNEGAHNHEWEDDVPVREIMLDADKEVYDVWGDVVANLDLIDLDHIRAYPNPFTTHINISGADWATNATVTDVLGNRVLETPLSGGRVDTGSLRPGMYLLHLRGDDGRQAVQRIIKH